MIDEQVCFLRFVLLLHCGVVKNKLYLPSEEDLPEKAGKSKKPTSGKPACGRSFLAESVGFEPTCPVKDNCISSAARYDRFDNSPYHICNISPKKL